MNNNGGSSSTPLAAAAAETTAHASGFRFHPTDEELVSDYLKPKVCGKLFNHETISELDIYKSEPWDLPAKSRIQTRDKEWYFFSTLDKKYATRSRTSRATGQGYWKTTGKDRPVRRNSRVVGMKKTLVFHVGRAPKGERTNWVMHEYRLEDENMTRTGIEQYAYVVCRIFQKTGSGPQNGAQYGAPVVDDWEEEDTDLVPKEEVCKEEDLEFDFNSPEFLRLIDFMENEQMGTGNENATASVKSDNGLDGSNYQVELAEIWQDENMVNGADGNINVPGLPDGQTLTGMDENSQCLAGLKDECVELNVFTDSVEGLRNYHKSINGVGESSNLPELNDGEEFFKTIDENNTLSEPSQIFPTAGNTNYLVADDFGISDFVDYPSGEPSDDGMLYFGAPSHDPTTEQGYIDQMNDLLNPTMADSTGIDMAEELLPYFDAPEDNSQYTVMHPNLENLNSATSFILDPYSSQANGVSIQAYDTCPQALEASGDRAASSSMKASETGGGSKVPEVVQSDDGDGEKKTIMERLVSMLGSIPSPPASAAELPLKGGKSLELSTASLSSRSIHFTAGMIQINGGLTRTGSGKHCSSVQDDGKVGFLLSYGMSRNDVVGNPKMHGGTMSLVLHSSCCRLFFSLLILAVSFKVGVCFYAS